MRNLLLGAAALLSIALPVFASFVDDAKKEINVKIVWWGPGAAAAVKALQAQSPAATRTDLETLALGGGVSTLRFSSVPPIGKIAGNAVRFHHYALAGTADAATRDLFLKGCDTAIFLAPADAGATADAKKSLADLRAGLKAVDRADAPLVLAADRSGAKAPTPVAQLATSLGLAPGDAEADSSAGAGLFDAFKAAAKATMKELASGLGKK